MAPLPPPSLKHKLPQDIAAELQAREEALQAAKEARAAERQARLAAREVHLVSSWLRFRSSPALLARPAGSPVAATAQGPAEVPAGPVAEATAQSAVPPPAVSATEPSTALQVAAAQVREALKRYRQVFRREALAPRWLRCLRSVSVALVSICS